MRTTIELPDELLRQAKARAAIAGISLREFFIAAVEQRLSAAQGKVRRPPPTIDGPQLDVLSPDQMDEAMFGRVPPNI